MKKKILNNYKMFIKKIIYFFIIYFYNYINFIFKNLKYIFLKNMFFLISLMNNQILSDKYEKELFNLAKSNLNIFYFFSLKYMTFVFSFQNQLMKQGKTTGHYLFHQILYFFKTTYLINATNFLYYFFFNTFELPYKLYILKMSNRNVYFPGPILKREEELAFLLKGFQKGIKQQYDLQYFNKVFLEIIAFLQKTTDSFLLKYLEQIVDQGMENRAFVHYRWILHKTF